MSATSVEKSISFEVDIGTLKISSKRPRYLDARLTNSSKKVDVTEKLAKVQARRQEIIESRRKACASSIARAKAIAVSQAKKFEDEILAKKLQIDQKLQGSEVRRLQLRSVSKSKLMDAETMSQVTAVVRRDQAACSIQGFWRNKKVSRDARAFKKLGFFLEKAEKMPFNVLLKKTQSEAVNKAVGRLLVRAKRMSNHPVENWKAPVKVFLSSYMIILHTQQVMASFGPTEETLKSAAAKMIKDFEDWVSHSSGPKTVTLARRFLASWIHFYEGFQAWKLGDSHKLVKDLVSHFMDLEKLWISVKDQEDAEAEWMPSMKEQQKQVHSRLAQLGPSAMEALYSERSAARSAIISDFPAEGMTPPRHVTMTNTSCDVYMPATPTRRDSVSRGARSSTPNSESSGKGAASAQRESIPAINSIWSNQKLAHELIMDPDFKMKRSDESSLEGKVAAMARKAFFETLREQLSQGKYDEVVPGLIKDIKDILIAMLPETSKVVVEISEVLDIEHIRQQIQMGAFDIPKCLHYITGKMLQLCAPVRDASIRGIAEVTDLTEAFERILDILEDMRFDLMNFQLQSVKPHLEQQAVGYERMKFDEALHNGQTSLEKTTRWLKKSVVDLQSLHSSRNPENVDHPDLKVRYENAYHDALMGLFFSTTPLDESEIAETLLLDMERILSLQNEAQAMTIIAALCMLSKSIIPELRTESEIVMSLKKNLYILLEAQDTTVENLALLIISTVNSEMEKAGHPLRVTVEQEKIIRNMVDKTLSFTDAVYSLISRRMQLVIRSQMERGIFKKESLTSYGLDTVAAELESLSKRICLLARHNKEVYVEHYDRILESLI